MSAQATTPNRKPIQSVVAPNAERIADQTRLMDAMCIWEVMLDAYQRDKHNEQMMSQIWEDMGTWQMRSYAADMIDDITIAWKIWEDVHNDLLSFDWEFVPNFLGRVKWTTSEGEHATFVTVDHDGTRIGGELLLAQALQLENL